MNHRGHPLQQIQCECGLQVAVLAREHEEQLAALDVDELDALLLLYLCEKNGQISNPYKERGDQALVVF
jgi:hypothetical protein